MRTPLLLTVLIALIVALPVTSGDAKRRTRTTFVSPTRTTLCQIVLATGKQRTYIRCDVQNATNAAPDKPKSCEFDWGFSFGMRVRGNAYRNCVSDAIGDPKKAKRLAYGATESLGGISCHSQQTGMTCTNKSGHGFSLSRQQQKLF